MREGGGCVGCFVAGAGNAGRFGKRGPSIYRERVSVLKGYVNLEEIKNEKNSEPQRVWGLWVL